MAPAFPGILLTETSNKLYWIKHIIESEFIKQRVLKVKKSKMTKKETIYALYTLYHNIVFVSH